jgi:hypothetical protein
VIKSIAHIQYHTHSVSIAMNSTTGHILCFKHDQRKCDFRVFDRGDPDSCADYIMESLPAFGWGFVEDSDENPQE